ncbi:MAG: prepilin-type N-terminal cleavage/methylation domain-containing protein [Christensenellales bacterium]
MMKRNTEKGFTVVELVIVVAVIAILAAVLVPTFSKVVRNAKVSKDVSLCKNVNIALAAQEATDGKPKRASDAIGKILNDGFVLNRLIPAAEGCYVVYDLTNNRFALLDSEFDIVYSETEISNNLYLLTGDQNTIDKAKLNETYSFKYLITTNENLTLDNSFDARLIVDCNVTLKTDNTECFIFTDGGNIVINAPQATITHVGNADTVTVDKVSGNSYHVQGTVNELILRSGRVVVEGDSVVDVIVIPEDADDYSIFVESADEKTNQGEIGQVIVNVATQEVVVKDKNSGIVVGVYYPTLPLGDTDKDVVFVYKNEDIKGGGVYKLMNDIEGSLTVSADETVVIDLNGKNFKATGTIVNNGTATIKNGTITRVTDYGDEQYCVENRGNLTLSDLTVVADSDNSPDAALIFNGNANETTSALTVNGGTYSTYGRYTVQNESGNTIINGGEFKCNYSSSSTDKGAVIFNNALLTVNDGKFFAETKNSYVIYSKNGSVSTVLNGGEYTGSGLYFNSSNTIEIKCGTFINFQPKYSYMAAGSFYLKTSSASAKITDLQPADYQAIYVMTDGKKYYYSKVDDLVSSDISYKGTLCLYKTPACQAKKVILNESVYLTVYLAYGVEMGTLSVSVNSGYEVSETDIIPLPEGFVSAKKYTAIITEASAFVKIINSEGSAKYYADYASARKEAKDGDTMVLLKDIVTNGNVSPSVTCTIELNGKILSTNYASGTIYPSANKTITIKDTIGGGKVVNTASTPYAVSADRSGSKVIIEGGTFEGYISGNVTVQGGTFSENPQSFITEGYEVKTNEVGYWVVVKKES